MSCTHEMKSGSVVTVVTRGGLAAGCELCRLDALDAELAQQRILLARISGALCDASTVVVEPYEQGIRDLTAERDAYRSALCDVVASASPNRKDHPTMHAAWEKARALLKDGPSTEPSGTEVRDNSTDSARRER